MSSKSAAELLYALLNSSKDPDSTKDSGFFNLDSNKTGGKATPGNDGTSETPTDLDSDSDEAFANMMANAAAAYGGGVS